MSTSTTRARSSHTIDRTGPRRAESPGVRRRARQGDGAETRRSCSVALKIEHSQRFLICRLSSRRHLGPVVAATSRTPLLLHHAASPGRDVVDSLYGLNAFKSCGSIMLTREGEDGEQDGMSGSDDCGGPTGLVSASMLWATVITVSPWLPWAAGIVDLTGVTVILSMLVCGFVPSLLLGGLLGRARACWALATCAALGPFLWILDFTVLSDPDVHSSDAVAIAFAGALALGLVSVPLLGGAIAGRWCASRRHAAR